MGLRYRSGNYFRFFIYLVVVVLVNIAGITLFFRADLTRNRVYSISQASRDVVSSLSEPLTINVFFTKKLPAPHNNTERYLHDLLKEYAVYADKHFNYRFYDVSPEEGDMSEEAKKNQELARNYGIYPVQIQVIEEDEVRFQQAYMGMALLHGDIIERIPTITSTDGLEYMLTTAIRKLNNKISALLRLSEKIKVKLFLSSSLKAVAPYIRLNDLPRLPESLKDVVEKVNAKNYGKLDFKYFDPTRDTGLESQMERYNILKLKWPALSGGGIEPGEGVVGLVMEYGKKVLEIPLIHVLQLPFIGKHYEMVDLARLEEMINEGVESLIDINEDLGYLADHGTLEASGGAMGLEMTQGVSSFRTLASQNYAIKDVNLKDATLPESVNCLIIAGPTERFTDYEIFQIDQFMMRGKSLALFIDAFKEVLPSGDPNMPMQFNQGPRYVSLDTGLEKLLEHYGIRIKKSYVMDESCYKQRIPAQMGGGERPIYFAPLIKNEQINNDLNFIKDIKGLIVMKVSPLEMDKERVEEKGLKASMVFSSSGQSWEKGDPIDLNPMFIQPPQSGEKKKSMPLAYLLEGEFPSYFAGKPIPEKKSEEAIGSEDKGAGKEADKETGVDVSKISGEGEFLSKGKPGKIFVIASSEMLKDNMMDETGRSPNAVFIMNVVDFLNNREAIAEMRGKEQSLNPLDETGAGVKTFVKSFNIAGLPVLVWLFGILVWFRRRSRKKGIQMMFAKS